MEARFKDKVAIVTGGAFGIGRAAAVALAREGAKLVSVDWAEDNETMSQIMGNGGEAIFVKCDVSKAEDVRAMVEQTIATYECLDIAFNNAGIEDVAAPTAECTE